MLYFKTPEEYLQNYDPDVARQYDNACPHCHTLSPKTKFSVRRHAWRCLHCRHWFSAYERVLIAEGPQTTSPEQCVANHIRSDYTLSHVLVNPTPGAGRGVVSGLIGAAAQIGMYSHDGTFARESMVYTAQQQLRQYQQTQSVKEQRRVIDEEYRYACALADEYFHGEERRNAAADAEVARLRLIGETIADSMARRVDQYRDH